jgi:hypothetical protein
MLILSARMNRNAWHALGKGDETIAKDFIDYMEVDIVRLVDEQVL